ncbi:MAG: LysM peptidoglycan-binding domain-containing protein [Treponema sp.]|jgi:LysM repeat protein|nr:LysM peptidoglycan-binding domain-containing protein [Treponema sp.]
MAATIGIKIANGDFYSIMEENAAVKKRLVLTTVHDRQKSVQIDLYKSHARSMADAMYIGSLVVENLNLRPKGDPSIELVISSSAEGVISAESSDLGNPSGEHQQLSLHLKSFEEDTRDYSGFDIEESGHSLYAKSAAIKAEDQVEKRKFPWIPAILLLVIVLLGLGWFFFLRGKALPWQAGKVSPGQSAAVTENAAPETPAAPPRQAEPAAPTKQAEPAAPAARQPVVIDTPPRAQSTAPERRRSGAPVYSFRIPQTIPPEGVVYTIRWGDTLWDISEAFYRNPWLYPRIVRHNRIRNPNLIVSGTEITIPARE